VTCVGQPPATLDDWLAIIDRCAASYGGADWEQAALRGLPVFLLLVFVIAVIAITVRALR
jgi:hypothetical protein